MTLPQVATRSRQVCAACGATFDDRFASVGCPKCSGLLDLEHDPVAEDGRALRARFDARVGTARGASASGVWRFREMVLPDADDAAIVTYPEGNTPLLVRPSVRAWAGAPHLLMKHEGQNPTGSFKDRGMTVALTQARRIGASAVACASTGNTSSSLAAYAALAGIPALVLVPAGRIAMGKLAQTLAYGARTLLIKGDFDTCLTLTREATEHLGVYLVNSINPFRIEGQKTIIFEMLQQLDWEAPDWITLPAGNLGNAAAFGKALREARAAGLITRVPRLALIQAGGANPFAQSFRDAFAVRHRVTPSTIATAINIGNPASYDRAVRTIRETNGVVTDVTDAEILEAKAVIDASGTGCEPASAASVAGVRRLVREGVISPNDRIVSVLTGHLLKDPGILLDPAAAKDPTRPGGNRPIEIEPRLEEVERILREAAPGG